MPVGVVVDLAGDGLVKGLGAVKVEVLEMALEEAGEVGGGAAFLGAVFGASPEEDGGLLKGTPLLEDAAASTSGLTDKRDDLKVSVLGLNPRLFEGTQEVDASEKREYSLVVFFVGLCGLLGFPRQFVGGFFESGECDLAEGFVFFEEELCRPIEPDMADRDVLKEALCGLAGLGFVGVVGEQSEDAPCACAGILGEGRMGMDKFLDGARSVEGMEEGLESLARMGVESVGPLFVEGKSMLSDTFGESFAEVAEEHPLLAEREGDPASWELDIKLYPELERAVIGDVFEAIVGCGARGFAGGGGGNER